MSKSQHHSKPDQVNIVVGVDPVEKHRAKMLAESLGISMSETVRITLAKLAEKRGITAEAAAADLKRRPS